LAKEAEQILRSRAIQWDIAKLIDDDQIATANMIFQLRYLALFTCFDVGVGQLCGGKAFGFVTPPTSFTSQSNCQVRFARSGGAVKDEVSALFDELAFGQINHALFIELGNGGEVKVGKFLDQWEARLFDSSFNSLSLTMLNLQFGQLLEEGFVGRIFGSTLPGHSRMFTAERRQLQCFKMTLQ